MPFHPFTLNAKLSHYLYSYLILSQVYFQHLWKNPMKGDKTILCLSNCWKMIQPVCILFLISAWWTNAVHQRSLSLFLKVLMFTHNGFMVYCQRNLCGVNVTENPPILQNGSKKTLTGTSGAHTLLITLIETALQWTYASLQLQYTSKEKVAETINVSNWWRKIW